MYGSVSCCAAELQRGELFNAIAGSTDGTRIPGGRNPLYHYCNSIHTTPISGGVRAIGKPPHSTTAQTPHVVDSPDASNGKRQAQVPVLFGDHSLVTSTLVLPTTGNNCSSDGWFRQSLLAATSTGTDLVFKNARHMVRPVELVAPHEVLSASEGDKEGMKKNVAFTATERSKRERDDAAGPNAKEDEQRFFIPPAFLFEPSPHTEGTNNAECEWEEPIRSMELLGAPESCLVAHQHAKYVIFRTLFKEVEKEEDDGGSGNTTTASAIPSVLGQVGCGLSAPMDYAIMSSEGTSGSTPGDDRLSILDLDRLTKVCFSAEGSRKKMSKLRVPQAPSAFTSATTALPTGEVGCSLSRLHHGGTNGALLCRNWSSGLSTLRLFDTRVATLVCPGVQFDMGPEFYARRGGSGKSLLHLSAGSGSSVVCSGPDGLAVVDLRGGSSPRGKGGTPKTKTAIATSSGVVSRSAKYPVQCLATTPAGEEGFVIAASGAQVLVWTAQELINSVSTTSSSSTVDEVRAGDQFPDPEFIHSGHRGTVLSVSSIQRIPSSKFGVLSTAADATVNFWVPRLQGQVN